LARITRVEERVVDLSKSIGQLSLTANNGDGRSIGEVSENAESFDDENPFELSDGLRWYMLDANEEKGGAPTTPGLAKSTVASANVDARGSVRVSKGKSGEAVAKTLSKSLASRRSSTNSRADATGKNSPVVGSPRGVVSPGRRSRDGADPTVASGLGMQLRDDAPTGSMEVGDGQTNGMADQQAPPSLRNQASAVSAVSTSTSPGKASKGMVQNMFDSLFSLDVSLESGKKRVREG
jgi:autophagy-related protein 11